jgi:uncharacterized protein HemX
MSENNHPPRTNKSGEDFQEEIRPLEIDEEVIAEARRPAQGQHRRGGGAAAFLSLLALLLAAGGIAAGYFLYQRDIRPLQNLPQKMVQLQENSASKAGLGELQQRLHQIVAGTEDLRSELTGAAGGYQQLEQQIAHLRQQTDWGRRDWTLAEVNYLQQMAGERLALLRDGPTAAAALRSALGRLDELSDPSLADLQQRLRYDLKAVESYRPLNPDQVLRPLQQLSATLQPIPQEPMTDTTEVAPESAETPSGLAGAWESFKHSMAGRVRVVQHEASLNALEQQAVSQYQYDLLALRLEMLRFALQRQDQPGFIQELTRLSLWADQSLPSDVAAAIRKETRVLGQLKMPPLPELSLAVEPPPMPPLDQVQLPTEPVMPEPSPEVIAPAAPSGDTPVPMEIVPEQPQSLPDMPVEQPVVGDISLPEVSESATPTLNSDVPAAGESAPPVENTLESPSAMSPPGEVVSPDVVPPMETPSVPAESGGAELQPPQDIVPEPEQLEKSLRQQLMEMEAQERAVQPESNR